MNRISTNFHVFKIYSGKFLFENVSLESFEATDVLWLQWKLKDENDGSFNRDSFVFTSNRMRFMSFQVIKRDSFLTWLFFDNQNIKAEPGDKGEQFERRLLEKIFRLLTIFEKKSRINKSWWLSKNGLANRMQKTFGYAMLTFREPRRIIIF